MTNPIVAVVESRRDARDTYGALLYIELGLTIVVGCSVGELLPALNGATPDLLLIGNDQTHAEGDVGPVAGLAARFPAVPLIAIGRHWASAGADGFLDEPVDALELLALIRLFLSEGRQRHA